MVKGDAIELRGHNGTGWVPGVVVRVNGDSFRAGVRLPGLHRGFGRAGRRETHVRGEDPVYAPPATMLLALDDEGRTWRRPGDVAVPDAPPPLEALGLVGSELALARDFFGF